MPAISSAWPIDTSPLASASSVAEPALTFFAWLSSLPAACGSPPKEFANAAVVDVAPTLFAALDCSAARAAAS